MRIRKLKGEFGGVIVFLILIVPIIISIIAALMLIGQIVFARVRLSVAADRAAYAGASSLADSMNRIAAANWGIRKAYRDLEGDFRAMSQQNRNAAQQRFERYSSEVEDHLSTIGDISSGMGDAAREIAEGYLHDRAPAAVHQVSVQSAITLSDSIDPERQHGNPSYDYITGPSFADPSDVDGGSFSALKFLIKESASGPSIVVAAAGRVRPLLLQSTFGDFSVSAISSAMAFGGSVEGFALKDGDSPAEAESRTAEDGDDNLYRAAAMPPSSPGGGPDA